MKTHATISSIHDTTLAPHSAYWDARKLSIEQRNFHQSLTVALRFLILRKMPPTSPNSFSFEY